MANLTLAIDTDTRDIIIADGTSSAGDNKQSSNYEHPPVSGGSRKKRSWN